MATMQSVKLAGITLVSLIIRSWSGAAVIKRDSDLSQVANQLPPKWLVVDGQKRLVNPALLAPLDALRKRAEAAVRAIGFKFLNGFAVPDSQLAELNVELQKIEASFAKYVHDEIELHLDDAYLEWEKKDPAWAAMLRAARLTPQEVASRCSFRWVCYKPALADAANPGALANQGLHQAAASIHEALYDDVAAQAASVIRSTFTGRSADVGQRALRPVRSLARKLASFSFIDAGAAKIAAVLEAALAGLPTQGSIDAVGVARIVGTLQRVADVGGIASILAEPQVVVPTAADPGGFALPLDMPSQVEADLATDDASLDDESDSSIEQLGRVHATEKQDWAPIMI